MLSTEIISELKSISEPTAKVDRLLNHAFDLRVSNVQESINLAEEAVTISEEIHYSKGLAHSQSHLGLFYMIMGSNKEGLAASELALSYFEAMEDKSGMAGALYNIGSIQYKTSNHHVGLEYFYRCLSLQQEIKDAFGESKTLKAVGYIYETFGEFDKARDMYERCREISQSVNDKNGESNACNPLSGIYLKKDQFEEAFETINTSIRLKKETGDRRGLAFAYYGIAKIHVRLGEHLEAKKYLLVGLDIHAEVGEHLGSAMCLNKLGQLYYHLQDYDKASGFLNDAIEVGEQMDNQVVMYKAYYYHFKIAMAREQVKEALNYHIQYHEHKESVINSETSGRIKSLEAMWKADNMEREANIQMEKNVAIEKKNAELDTFVYRVSHDLRGPISSLLGLYTVVKMDIEDEKSLEYFEIYQEQISRLNIIIIDLIELTKVKDWALKKVGIDFDKMVNECISSFNYLPNFEHMVFDINIQKNLNIKSDRSLMNTLLQNLIENGIKYSKAEGNGTLCIDINLVDEEKLLSIVIEDDGIGIAEEHKERIFEMFFRANSDVQGSGLGMYILKNAVDKLEGAIDLQTQLGKGSRFEILLPL